jgi:hypothetical protein
VREIVDNPAIPGIKISPPCSLLTVFLKKCPFFAPSAFDAHGTGPAEDP